MGTGENLQTVEYSHRQNSKIIFYFLVNIPILILPFNSTCHKRLEMNEQAHSDSYRWWCLDCLTLEMHQWPSLRNMQSFLEGGPHNINFKLKIPELCIRIKNPKAQCYGLGNQQPIQLLYMLLNTPFFSLPS